MDCSCSIVSDGCDILCLECRPSKLCNGGCDCLWCTFMCCQPACAFPLLKCANGGCMCPFGPMWCGCCNQKNTGEVCACCAQCDEILGCTQCHSCCNTCAQCFAKCVPVTCCKANGKLCGCCPCKAAFPPTKESPCTLGMCCCLCSPLCGCCISAESTLFCHESHH